MIDHKVKTLRFWLMLGAVNNCVMLIAIAIGCAASDFTCSGNGMTDVMNVYVFTLFTPQLALAAIVIMAALLVTNSKSDVVDSGKFGVVFAISSLLLTLFAVNRWA